MFSAALFPVLLSGGIDPDVAAWRAAISANGGSVGTSFVLEVNRFVLGCKADGVWGKLLDVGLFAGVDNLAAALVKLKTPAGVQRVLTNNNFVSADYTPTGASAGLKGNDTTKSLVTGFIPSAWLSTSTGLQGVYRTSAATGGEAFGSVTVTERMSMLFNSTNTAISDMHSVATRASVAAAGYTGFILGSRTSTTSHVLYRNGASIASSAVLETATICASNYRLFALSDNTSYGDQREAAYVLGFGLTATQAASLSARLNTLMTAVGANTY
jgi:hypothetical protein